MLVVGLTGNIAAGKSSVAARLAHHGVRVIASDQLAREAVAVGSPALARIAAQFGRHVLAADGSLDRAALRRIVFADAAQRRALEAITHPEVERLRQDALARARADGLALVVCDIPLLFEVGLERQMDRVVVVDAPTEVRRLRLMRDRGLSAADADAMIAAQWPAESKRARADYVIDNDGTLAQLESRTDELLHRLRLASPRSA
ncbi:MAG: dephospho-CoA kinase [Gemmatimonadaceae bacterium]|nr:dephospho-CoA kinase [Gemmatimonadaceae bacterium]